MRAQGRKSENKKRETQREHSRKLYDAKGDAPPYCFDVSTRCVALLVVDK